MTDSFLGFDAVTLARIQFGFTVAWHFIFPAFTIGLASYLAVLNGLWLKTRDHTYLELFRYWVKIFAISFAMGVVSGIVMSYQFGTNWSVFSDIAGPVIGPLMAYEVLTAFFLEAGFLGIMLFGREKVGPKLHMVACIMVAFGTALSATWIISVNSWMHTPQGFAIGENGQFLPTDWIELIFNPSMPYRLAHVLTAAYLTTALIVGGVGALHLLRGDRTNRAVRRMFAMAMGMVAIMAPLQLVLGHEHGVNTLAYQPQKIMAMEGHFQDYPDGAPLYLFGIPDQEAGVLKYAVGIPNLGSLILKGDLSAPVRGLNSIADADEPPVGIVFWSFRIMVGLGVLMIGLGLAATVTYLRRRDIFHATWLQRAALLMAPSGLIAVTAGWITTEVGRQPFVVYGTLRTADAVSPVTAQAVGTSLIAFIVIYFLVFGAGIVYLLRLMNKPPTPTEKGARSEPPIRTAGITPAPQLGKKQSDQPAE